MTTWGEYKTRIRGQLGDSDEPYYWSPDELRWYADAGFDDYSRHFPLQDDIEIAVVSGQKAYALPSDILTPAERHVASVEYPSGRYLQPLKFKPGDVRLYSQSGLWKETEGVGLAYYIWGSTLYLTRNPTELTDPLAVMYLAHHAHIVDDDTELTIPDVDLPLLMWFITATAMARVAAQDARLSRWKEEGSRSDSPLIPEHQWRMQQYHNGIAQRSKPRPRKLYRRRR